VSRLIVSQATGAKIAQRHGISPDEVWDAVVCVSGLAYVWDCDPERGERAIVETYIRERRTLVVLYPASGEQEDVYNLGSAYPVGP
jgi:hypothetical protein